MMYGPEDEVGYVPGEEENKDGDDELKTGDYTVDGEVSTGDVGDNDVETEGDETK